MRSIGFKKSHEYLRSDTYPHLPNKLNYCQQLYRLCDGKIAALERETEHLDELFHAMLEELMTGQRSAVPLIDAELPN